MKLPPISFNIAKASALLPIGIAIFFAVLIANSLYKTQVLKPWQVSISKRVEVDAISAANLISAFVKELNNQLNEAISDYSLVKAILSNEDSFVKEAQLNLQQKLPMLEEVLLLRKAEDYLASSENFVALDLLRKSISGKSPDISAIKLSDIWTVYVAIPLVKDNDSDVAGSLLVSFPVNAVRARLAEHFPTARISILQTSENFQPQTIFSQGSSASTLNITVPIAGVPDWKLAYTAPENLAEDVNKSIKYFLVSLGGITLITLAIIALSVRYSGWIAAQLSKLTKGATKRPATQDEVSPEELDKLITKKMIQREKIEKPVAIATELDSAVSANPFPEEIFRCYDIRGKANSQITPVFAEALGKTLGTQVILDSQSALLVAADGRTSSPALQDALVKGILSTGCNVIDIGRNSTPVFNFAIQNIDEVKSGVIVTASHNPAGDNGFKIIMDNKVLTPSEIKQLAEEMRLADWERGSGEHSKQDIVDTYSKAIVEDVSIGKSLNVVVDCGNGVMGAIAPQILSTLGCQVTPLYCDIDGDFPNHSPDPSNPANLQDLITTVLHENADIGLAFDGDGDRLVAVSGTGQIIWPDELMMIFSRDLLTRQPESTIVFDVKSTRRLAELINNYGGTPVMCQTGHSNIRRELLANKAPLAGEYSGHIFFSDRWFGFDDGLYAAARLIEIIDLREQSLDKIVSGFDKMVATPEIRVPIDDDRKFDVIEQISNKAIFNDGTLNKLDGLRVDFENGWGLIRASNTSAALTLRFEAVSEQALGEIQRMFKEQIADIVPEISLP